MSQRKWVRRGVRSLSTHVTVWCGEGRDQGLVSGPPGTDLGQEVSSIGGGNVIVT